MLDNEKFENNYVDMVDEEMNNFLFENISDYEPQYYNIHNIYDIILDCEVVI